MKVDVRQAVNLPPEEAIQFLDAKGYRVSVSWTDTWQDEHASAFTVAKVAKIDLLREIHVSLIDAMAKGQTFESWKDELQPKLVEAGWWGRVVNPELTGTGRTVIVGPRRLRTIYDTNLRMARATALWGRIEAGKAAMPYLRYSAVMDGRTRPQHRAWHDIVLPVDHPWWRTHFPPNGWNCRCTVVQMNDRMLARRGLKVSADPPEGPPSAFFRSGSFTPEFVPRGIDPGFAYNPGTARATLTLEKAADSLARAADVPGLVEVALADIIETLPGGPPARAAIEAMVTLARAGKIKELAAKLAELLGVVTAASEAGDIQTAARGGRRGGKPISARLSALAARRTRDAGGRFADEADQWQLGGLDYRDLAKGKRGRFVVIGTLDRRTARLIGAPAGPIRLSAEDAAKQLFKRPAVMPVHYRRAPEMFASGRLYRDGSAVVAHYRMDGQDWHAVLKPTAAGELYLNSLRPTDAKNMAGIARRAILLRE